MAGSPFFSITIPAYNRAYILEETISSIQAQTFTDWEVIVVDDGSTDNTKDVVETIGDRRVRYIYQHNAERSVARNNGADHAKGTYLLFLDSDDKYAPEHLDKLADFLKSKGTPVAMAFTSVCYLTENGLEKPEIPVMKDEGAFDYLLLQPITPSRVCIHRDIFKTFRFDPKIVIVEDLVLWVCIASEFPVYHLPEFTLYYRIHGGNSIDLSRDSYTSRLKGLFRLFNDKDYSAVSSLIPQAIKQHLLAECYFNIARHFEYIKNYKKMNRELWRSFSHKSGYRNKERLYMFLTHFRLTAGLLRKKL